jgi:antitoxin ParD1/3/4
METNKNLSSKIPKAKKSLLIKELKRGEQSGFVKNFDKKQTLNDLHKKYLEKQ